MYLNIYIIILRITLSDHQSGCFLPGRSTTTQLIEVYHAFCNAIDHEKEVRVIFLDIKKAFDRVWHKGLLHKLYLAGVQGEILLWLENYLSNRRQRVVLHGQYSDWGNVSAGVPQGSVLGPLLFLLFINDLTHEIRHCNIRFFADDTCLFIEVDDREEAVRLIENDLSRIIQWSNKWLVKFSSQKTKSLIISNKIDRRLNPPITFDNETVAEVNHHTYLGLKFSFNLKWNEHINDIYLKAKSRLNMMVPLKYRADRKTLEIMYKTFVRPLMEYGIVVWGGTYDSSLTKLEELNITALRLITGATANSNIRNLFSELPIESIVDRRDVAVLTKFFKIKNNLAPNYLTQLIPLERSEIVNYNLRNSDTIVPPFARLESLKRSFVLCAIKLWNRLLPATRTADSLHSFKQLISKKDKSNPLYYYGKRWSNIHHARLRMGCSGLNQHLYTNLHVIQSPQCSSNEGVESPYHYFIQCKHYVNERDNLVREVTKISNFNIDTLLFGDPILPYKDNVLIFECGS